MCLEILTSCNIGCHPITLAQLVGTELYEVNWCMAVDLIWEITMKLTDILIGLMLPHIVRKKS